MRQEGALTIYKNISVAEIVTFNLITTLVNTKEVHRLNVTFLSKL